MTQEIYLRAHTVASKSKRTNNRDKASMPIWPDRILIFDTETTIDERQDLTFGVYRLCELNGRRNISAQKRDCFTGMILMHDN